MDMVKDAMELRSNPIGAGSANGAAIRATKPGSVGFIGLGRMGTNMAANLAAAGYRVIAYVRRADQMDKLAELSLKPTTKTIYSTAKSSSACCQTTPPFATS